jgi:hypothetical protein
MIALIFLGWLLWLSVRAASVPPRGVARATSEGVSDPDLAPRDAISRDVPS